MAKHGGDVLFEDRFDGESSDRWPIPPISLTEDPEHGKVLHLKAGDPNAGLWLGWVGDETWRNYRVELEVLPTSEGGFIGFDFHVQDDGSGCCNLHFPVSIEGGKRLFEGCGCYGDSNTSWKLGPLSQRSSAVPAGEWIKLRLDAGETIANLYVQNGGGPNHDSQPVFTVYDLPFAAGGIRLWRYYASACFRNLRVTTLDRVEPILDDSWGSVVSSGVIRNWSVSRMFPRDFGSDDAVAAARGEDMGWRDVTTDRRGVVNVVAIDPVEYCQPGVVFAKTTIGSQAETPKKLRLTYTDQLSVWVNGVPAFDGERRGWNDPGRSDEDGWGRLMPDQFEVELHVASGDVAPDTATPGENEILVRLEVNEPLFGSGFWMRALDAR